MTSIAVVLYEDERGPTTQFGLHELVLACVADDLNTERYLLQKIIECHPMKGVSKVLQSCYRDVRRLSARGQRVFALIDDDHVREQLPGMDPLASVASVVEAIRKKSDCPEQLEVILLGKNTESVIEAAKLCDPEAPDDAVRKALAKDLTQRDRMFHRAASRSLDVRRCIRAKIPALEKLVAQLVAIARTRLQIS